VAVGNGNGNVIRPDFFPFFRRVGTFHHFYFDVVIPTSLGAKIFSNVATNILTLTAVLMGLRNIGNFFCHICASRESSQGMEFMMLRPCSIVQIFCHGAYAAIQYGEL
jgi:hypothetical protein